MNNRIDEHSFLEIFTRTLAHDLKEPMRTMRAYCDLIGTHQKGWRLQSAAAALTAIRSRWRCL